MNRKITLSLIAAGLGLLASGCDSLPFLGGNQSPPSPAAPSPVAASPSPVAASPATPPAINSPVAPPKAVASPGTVARLAAGSPQPPTFASPVAQAPSALIQSVPPEELLRRDAQQSRPDPFAVVATQPVVRAQPGAPQAAAAANPLGAVATAVPVSSPVPALPAIPLPPVLVPPTPAVPVARTSPPPVRTPPAATPRATASPVRPSPFVPILPALPEPDLARAVEVSGVIEIEGATPKAIVKSPGESTVRYVSPGERLGDGTVLVKRIEPRAAGGPMVVLEQFGIEVVRRVGQTSTTATPSGSR
jgi:hypothetical protein